MKKNLIINSEICDARKIKEEHYAGYEQIMLNAEILLVNDHSKEVFHRLPLTENVEIILEVEEDAEFSTVNGNYEITGGMAVKKNSVLLVNGNLRIGQGTQELLKQYKTIQVNGSIRCPRSMAAFLDNIQVNGATVMIPDDCIELKDDFEMDSYFHLRAKENGVYFANKRVKILDTKIDTELLKKKNVHFITKSVLTREELIPEVIGMFDENTELQVVPVGYAYVKEDAVLNEALVAKYGNTLYIDGSLTLDKNSTPWLEKIEQLYVVGDVSLLSSQVEAFRSLEAEYKELVIVKGKMVKNTPLLTVDRKMLELAEDGVTVKNCARLNIKKDILPETILEKLQIINCASVQCSPEQKSAVQMVGKHIASISDGENKGESGGILGTLKNLAESKMINAEKYSL